MDSPLCWTPLSDRVTERDCGVIVTGVVNTPVAPDNWHSVNHYSVNQHVGTRHRQGLT